MRELTTAVSKIPQQIATQLQSVTANEQPSNQASTEAIRASNDTMACVGLPNSYGGRYYNNYQGRGRRGRGRGQSTTMQQQVGPCFVSGKLGQIKKNCTSNIVCQLCTGWSHGNVLSVVST